MFETLFLMLVPYINSTQSMRVLIAEIQDLIATERAAATSEMRESYAAMQSDNDKRLHELLVNVCISQSQILDALTEGKKITAIKHLRGIVGHQNASLVATERAVEDHRVSVAANTLSYNRVMDTMTQECSE